jgi:energy-coupling factor transport system ATP-binding protein
VGLVPQSPGDLLYLDSVEAECDAADVGAGVAPGSTRSALDELVPGIGDDLHPRDLSEGQRLGLVLAMILASSPRVLLLDEPTRGLDYPSKARFAARARRLAEHGRAVLVATHDVELAASLANRVIVMADGELVADGSPDEVLSTSAAFASQVSRIVGPSWLTVDDVRAGLAAMGGRT